MNASKHAFQFKLQEDKYNELHKQIDLKNMSVKFPNEMHNSLKSPNLENNLKSHSEINSKYQEIEPHSIDFNNKAIKLLVDRYQTEISHLKSYILKVNTEIRKKINIPLPEIPSKIELNDLDEMLERLVNPEYINPIFKIYDTNLKFLEEENKKLIKEKEKQDRIITELLQENSFLREENLYYKEETKKQVLNKIINSDTKFLYNEEFIKQVEDRSNLLSRENELLTINYSKITKDFFEFKIHLNDKYQEYLTKSTLFDRISNESRDKTSYIEQLTTKLTITENKLFEVVEYNSNLESFKENSIIEINRLKNEIEGLKESNEFLKKQIEI